MKEYVCNGNSNNTNNNNEKNNYKSEEIGIFCLLVLNVIFISICTSILNPAYNTYFFR